MATGTGCSDLECAMDFLEGCEVERIRQGLFSLSFSFIYSLRSFALVRRVGKTTIARYFNLGDRGYSLKLH